MSRQQRTQNYYQLNIRGDVYKGTVNELAEQTGRPIKHIWSIIDGSYKDIHGEQIGKSHPIFDYYNAKTGEHLGTYTLNEMADVLDVKPKTLSNKKLYRKTFTGKYKIVEDEDMITRRTINKVAPVPVPEKYEPERKINIVTVKPAEKKPFKVGKYAQYLHDSYFAKWNLKEGK